MGLVGVRGVPTSAGRGRAARPVVVGFGSGGLGARSAYVLPRLGPVPLVPGLAGLCSGPPGPALSGAAPPSPARPCPEPLGPARQRGVSEGLWHLGKSVVVSVSALFAAAVAAASRGTFRGSLQGPWPLVVSVVLSALSRPVHPPLDHTLWRSFVGHGRSLEALAGHPPVCSSPVVWRVQGLMAPRGFRDRFRGCFRDGFRRGRRGARSTWHVGWRS